jgi:prepilin-type N-terminal cleavage/methylation domain-containing protein
MGRKDNKGFTLVELLVVVAIIGLLASIIIVSLNSARTRAKDARRLSDIRAIISALELYYHDNEQYPGPTSSYGESEGTCGGWDTSTVDNDGDGKPFIEPLIDGDYLSSVPTDPVGSGTCSGLTYRYYRYGAGTSGCDSSRGAFYVLEIIDMETSGRPHPQSPGWSCPARNWQNEADWVTGRFEQ